MIFADFCGPLITIKQGRRYVFAIIDSKTKYILLKAVNYQDEMTVVSIIRDDWILKFGVPRVLHTDRGRSFEGKKLLDLAKDCGFVMEYSSPYHHSSNGQIERQFRTIRDSIVLKLNEKEGHDWAEYLPKIEFMMNATYQRSLEMSPAEAVFGRKIRCENVNFERSNFAENPNMTLRRFGVGQKVLVKRNMTSKDEDRYERPGTIEERIHDRSYRIGLNNGRTITRNIEWLKPFKEGGCEK